MSSMITLVTNGHLLLGLNAKLISCYLRLQIPATQTREYRVKHYTVILWRFSPMMSSILVAVTMSFMTMSFAMYVIMSFMALFFGTVIMSTRLSTTSFFFLRKLAGKKHSLRLLNRSRRCLSRQVMLDFD